MICRILPSWNKILDPLPSFLLLHKSESILWAKGGGFKSTEENMIPGGYLTCSPSPRSVAREAKAKICFIRYQTGTASKWGSAGRGLYHESSFTSVIPIMIFLPSGRK
jgi:hypothetical protein